MRDKIIWSTTAERLEQRKTAVSALSKIFDLEWHLMDNVGEHSLLPEIQRENGSALILVFEIDSPLAENQYKAITRMFRPNYERNRSVVIIGLLSSKNLPAGQMFQRYRAYMDGIIVQSTSLADELELLGLAPVTGLPLPKTLSAKIQQSFAKGFDSFVNDLRVARLKYPVMKKLANELVYLGVEDDWILIDAVAELITKLG